MKNFNNFWIRSSVDGLPTLFLIYNETINQYELTNSTFFHTYALRKFFNNCINPYNTVTGHTIKTILPKNYQYMYSSKNKLLREE